MSEFDYVYIIIYVKHSYHCTGITEHYSVKYHQSKTTAKESITIHHYRFEQNVRPKAVKSRNARCAMAMSKRQILTAGCVSLPDQTEATRLTVPHKRSYDLRTCQT